MRTIQRLGLLVLATTVACSGAERVPSGSPEWAGDITTDGDHTTIVNESGSVWGGAARLVEEASIGVDAGDDPYMLGFITAVAATDELILIADEQVPAVRVYDHAGAHLYDVGGPGQGPGEYQRLSSVAVASDGRIFVRDDRARRILIYGPEGAYLTGYQMPAGLSSSTPMVLTREDIPYTVTIVRMLMDDPGRIWQLGMQAYGPEGPIDDPIAAPIDESFTPRVLSNEQRSMQRPVPFYPEEAWALTPDLDLIYGVPTDYRFRIDRANGTSIDVEKFWESIAVDADEADWHRRYETAAMRSMVPEWIWNAEEVPTTKPPYHDFFVARSGEIWVRRPGPGRRLPDCDPDTESLDEMDARPCWDETTLVDVFDRDGRFLGPLDLPVGFSFFPHPFIDGDLVIARVDDDAGIARIKRYRIEPPG